jgi:hypothetical protein
MHFSLCCVSATWISLLLFLFFSSLWNHDLFKTPSLKFSFSQIFLQL